MGFNSHLKVVCPSDRVEALLQECFKMAGTFIAHFAFIQVSDFTLTMDFMRK